ncbi:MAG: hypothetical protein HWD85_00510 [Flavobacteriaceae bacterium]|nr:hypothetical protein [Flavobacteriaceae bacterium]
MYIYWGWNRANYSNSDIHFKGVDYDFTLSSVKAKDRITPFSFYNYFNPTRITIPQTNFRIGYFFHKNYSISIGVEHMKYVMTPYQSVKINGTINTGGIYDKVYTDEAIILKHNFLEFEHTDGLNYINVEVKRFDDFSHLLGLENPNFTVNLTEGVGAGFIYPKTNARLLENERYDDFNVAGWGVSASVGVNLTFFKYYFIQSDVMAGYMNMPNIRTTKNETDSASQKFTFLERTIVFGAKFNILNRK